MRNGACPARLTDWLDWQQTLHPLAIDLGLDRVARALRGTGWQRGSIPVLTVGGTNGKGSCVAMLDAILREAGYRVGTFTSPHLVDYRERIRLDGRMVSEASLVAAFERVDAARGDDSLTFFEFNALAALLVFETFAPDVIVLEVGMGGRLDAVNVVDADVAILASVGLDHMEWLGADVEAIGREKAGIFRGGRPAICGMRSLPASVLQGARDVGAVLQVRGRDFDALPLGAERWDFVCGGSGQPDLPAPALGGVAQFGNAATVLAALAAISDRLPVGREAIERGLRSVSLPGRFQRIADPRGFEWVFDVAHNPDAAAVLAANLASHPVPGRTIAICGMLGDKDVTGVLERLRDSTDVWLAAVTDGPRGMTDAQLAVQGRVVGIDLQLSGPVHAAIGRAARLAGPGDRVVVFGSFHTVGPALTALGYHL
jgi:dihydrofolate synthase/folylpolyglutamate synthase